MHDILVTLGITLLLLLIIVTGIGIWILWSFRPITQKEQDDLMDTINRLKAEEGELRARVDRDREMDKEWNEAINQCKHPRHDALMQHWAINNDLNERTKR